MDLKTVSKTESDEARTGPRDLKPKDSKQYAIQTITYMKRLWQSRKASMIVWGRAIEEAEKDKIWIALGLNSLDDLLKAEIGITKEQSLIELNERDKEEQRNSKQGNRTDLHDNLIDNINKVKIPDGTSRQYALRRLRKSAPELHDKVIQGKLSPNKAMIEAGYRKKKVSVHIDSGAVAKMILKYFSKEDITDIIGMLEGEDSDGVGKFNCATPSHN